MKTLTNLLTLAGFAFFTQCGDNETIAVTGSSPGIETKTTPVSSSSATGDDLIGTWKLSKEVFDDNRNRVPDEEELKKAYSNNYLLQLNADGSCRIQQIFTGRYEKKTEKGRNMLYVYRKKIEGEEDKDPPPDIYQVTSLKKDELVLQIIEMGDPGSFWFFNRIK